jgi:hypothetical protein
MSQKSIMSVLDFCNIVKEGFENSVSNPPVKYGRVIPVMKSPGLGIPLEKEDFSLKVNEMSKTEVIKKFRTGEFILGFWSSMHSIKGGTCIIVKVKNNDVETGTIILPMGKKIFGANFVFKNDKICRNDKVHYEDINPHRIRQSDTISSPQEYELPEKCIFLSISGHFCVPYLIEDYIRFNIDRE